MTETEEVAQYNEPDATAFSVDPSLQEKIKATRTVAYEYGIKFTREHMPGTSNADDRLHRYGMTFDLAKTWIAEWIVDANNPKANDLFEIIRRPIGQWETFDTSIPEKVDTYTI